MREYALRLIRNLRGYTVSARNAGFSGRLCLYFPHRGGRVASSLVEILIALMVLSVVLLGIMTAMTVTYGVFASKEAENARLLALRFFEECEGRRLTEIEGMPFDVPPGFSIDREVILSGSDSSSARVNLTVSWIAPGSSGKSLAMDREVSLGGWRNVGEFPK